LIQLFKEHKNSMSFDTEPAYYTPPTGFSKGFEEEIETKCQSEKRRLSAPENLGFLTSSTWPDGVVSYTFQKEKFNL